MKEEKESVLSLNSLDAKKFAESYVDVHRPLLVTDLEGNGVEFEWMQKERWRPTVLKELAWVQAHEETVVDVACRDSSKMDTYSGDERLRENVEMRFGSFMDVFVASYKSEAHWANDIPELNFYLCQCPFLSEQDDVKIMLPSLSEEVKMPSLLKGQQVLQANLWMGIESTRTTLHYDAFHNLLFVLHGRKRVTLFPPSDTLNLYSRPVYATSANHSTIDIAKMNSGLYPNLKNTSPLNFLVESGSALFIPEGWWHQVDSEEFTVAVNIWFAGMRVKMSQSKEMDCYYARTVMERLLKKEKQNALEKHMKKYHVEDQSGFAIDILVDNFGKLENRDDRETFLFRLGAEKATQCLPEIALRHPDAWKDTLNNASLLMVEYLTTAWEVDALWPSLHDKSQFFETLFGAFQGEGDLVRQSMLSKKETFARACFDTVLHSIYGFEPSEKTSFLTF